MSFNYDEETWKPLQLEPFCCCCSVVSLWLKLILWLTFSLISSALLHRGSASLYFPLFPYRTARLLRVAATWQEYKHIYGSKHFSNLTNSLNQLHPHVQTQDSTSAAWSQWSGERFMNEEENVQKQEVIMIFIIWSQSNILIPQHVHSEGRRGAWRSLLMWTEWKKDARWTGALAEGMGWEEAG